MRHPRRRAGRSPRALAPAQAAGPPWPPAAPHFAEEETEALRGKGAAPAPGEPPGPSARSPAPGPARFGEGGSPRSHRTDAGATPTPPPSAHRRLPEAAPSGGGVGMGLRTAPGAPGRTAVTPEHSPAAAEPRDTSPISAGSRVAAQRSAHQRRPGCPPAPPERSAHTTFPFLEPVGLRHP